MAVNRQIASLVDVMIGNEEDFTAALGFQVPGMDEHISKLDPGNFRKMIAEVVKMYPNFQGRGHYAAQCEDGDAQRLGRDSVDGRANSTRLR